VRPGRRSITEVRQDGGVVRLQSAPERLQQIEIAGTGTSAHRDFGFHPQIKHESAILLAAFAGQQQSRRLPSWESDRPHTCPDRRLSGEG